MCNSKRDLKKVPPYRLMSRCGLRVLSTGISQSKWDSPWALYRQRLHAGAPTHARSRSFLVQMSRPPTRNGAHKQFHMLAAMPVYGTRSINLNMSSHTGTYPTTDHHFTTLTSATKEAKAVVCSGACATVSTVCGLRPIQLHHELLRTGQGSAKPSSCGRLRLLKVQSRSHLPVIRMCDSRAPV